MELKKIEKEEKLHNDYPIFIMFSSRTTRKPKCMIQSGMGVLINYFRRDRY